MIRVGIFDSGVGGLSVLAACRRRLPQVTFYYLGDNKRAPYGSRPKEEIAAFTAEAVERFAKLGAAAAVLACNTATAVCLPALRERFSFPILGVEPAVLPAARAARDVLVLCTPRTAESERLRALVARSPAVRFTVFPCPRLAAAIEGKFLRGETLRLSDHLPEGKFGAVVLGCTHYALLAEEISAYYSAPVFDGAEGVAKRLAQTLFAPADEKTMWSGKNVQNKSSFRLWSEEGAINKSSPQKWRESALSGVFFLGESAKINRKVYKHSFK